MDPNVQRKAKELADALVASEAYQRLKAAREELERHEAAKIMLRDFTARQRSLQERVLRGEQPSEQEIAAFQEAAAIVSMNPYIRRLLEAEMAFGDLMVAVQRELFQAVGLELPEDAGAPVAAPPPQPPQQESKPKSRLWVPGRD